MNFYIRCLKCINNCKNNALEYKLSFFMKLYLKKKKKNLLIIYEFINNILMNSYLSLYFIK